MRIWGLRGMGSGSFGGICLGWGLEDWLAEGEERRGEERRSR